MKPSHVATVAVVLLMMWVAPSGNAEVLMNYLGSIDVASPSADPGSGITEYYVDNAAFVPAGNTRPGYGSALAYPTLILRWGWSNHTIEYSLNGVTPKTSSLDTMYAISNANGGTAYGGGVGPDVVDSAGNFYTTANSTGASGNNPGQGAGSLGGTSNTYATFATGWAQAGYYSDSITLRLGDGAGGNLPTAAGAGAHYLVAGEDDGQLGFGYGHLIVGESVDNGDGTVTGTQLFSFSGDGVVHFDTNIQYVRAVDGTEYIMLARKKVSKTGFTLSFYDPATASGVDPTPVGTVDIDAMITAGAGWRSPAKNGLGIALDFTNSTLYVAEDSYNYSRVHVFTVAGQAAVPEPATLALLAMGGLGMVGGRLRRRAR